ncbi:unnamed protein product, partial [Mesorhabditis spiculigera]
MSEQLKDPLKYYKDLANLYKLELECYKERVRICGAACPIDSDVRKMVEFLSGYSERMVILREELKKAAIVLVGAVQAAQDDGLPAISENTDLYEYLGMGQNFDDVTMPCLLEFQQMLGHEFFDPNRYLQNAEPVGAFGGLFDGTMGLGNMFNPKIPVKSDPKKLRKVIAYMIQKAQEKNMNAT